MGVYVYKISSKPCMTMDGRPVFEATYAYKPFGFVGDGLAKNKRMAFQTGVVSCERYWKAKPVEERTNVLVLYDNKVFEVGRCNGSVYDDIAFNKTPYAVLSPELIRGKS